MEASDMNSKRPQLRGQDLLNAIENCMRDLSSKKDNYVYNASEIARLTGCSRPTLNAKADFIDSVLDKIGVERRLKSTNPQLERLHVKINKLEAENTKLERELQSLRENHAGIYSTLLNHSVDASVLIAPIVQDESLKQGACVLCKQPVSSDHTVSTTSTVVQLIDHTKGSK